MKKRLEADLISIAHKILKLKSKSDINQLYLETQKLYEKLAILRFVEEHFGEAKPTIGQAEIVEKMKEFFENNAMPDFTPTKSTIKVVPEEIIEEETVDFLSEDELEQEEEVELIAEEIPEIDSAKEPKEVGEIAAFLSEEVADMELEDEDLEDEESAPETSVVEEPKEAKVPDFKLSFELDEEKETEQPKANEAVQISFEDILGGNYNDTFFVKVDQTEDTPTAAAIEIPIEMNAPEKIVDTIAIVPVEKLELKSISLNDKFSKGINIDLNDRIAFVKHLFGNSDEDYNRVLNQLITFNSFYETRDFIEDMVKPDYNNWEGKDDYEERFMDIIEKKFL
jgi:hypothetical protein